MYKAKAGLDAIVFPSRLQNFVAVRSIVFPFLKRKPILLWDSTRNSKPLKLLRFNEYPPGIILKSPKFVS